VYRLKKSHAWPVESMSKQPSPPKKIGHSGEPHQLCLPPATVQNVVLASPPHRVSHLTAPNSYPGRGASKQLFLLESWSREGGHRA